MWFIRRCYSIFLLFTWHGQLCLTTPDLCDCHRQNMQISKDGRWDYFKRLLWNERVSSAVTFPRCCQSHDDTASFRSLHVQTWGESSTFATRTLKKLSGGVYSYFVNIRHKWSVSLITVSSQLTPTLFDVGQHRSAAYFPIGRLMKGCGGEDTLPLPSSPFPSFILIPHL